MLSADPLLFLIIVFCMQVPSQTKLQTNMLRPNYKNCPAI